MIETVEPGWDAPAKVSAFCTLRHGGVSQGPYSSLNLALHVGDDPAAVRQNRERLRRALALPNEPQWLGQTHGVRAVVLEQERDRDADASITRRPGTVAAVMVADCLPILLCNRAGTEVAAVHAGWRGLAAGVIQSTLVAMRSPASELLAWIGPGISAPRFEVGDEVRAAFMGSLAGAQGCFEPHGVGHWLCDLGGLAERVLRGEGVTTIYRDPGCTYRDSRQFFSYRRDRATGRMAALIWIN